MNEKKIYTRLRVQEQQDQIFDFARKYDFMWKRPQDFKDCITIHWKFRKKKNREFIGREYKHFDACIKLFEKYELDKLEHFYLDFNYKLSRIGIYSCTHFFDTVWAIPDDYKEVQEYVKGILPEWAEVRIKRGRYL